MKKTGLKFITALMTFACVTVMPLFAKEATTIKILHTNDTHSNVADDGKGVIGFAKFATFVSEAKEKGNVLVLDAGDMFQGLPFANLEQGQSIVGIANAVGYDAMTLGNHEFDFGSENLLNIISKLNYPVIAANFYKADKRVLDAYIVKEFDGVKVGIFGMATEETAFKSHPKNTAGYRFADMIAEAKSIVTTLKNDEKVDVIIMLSHLGLDEGNYTSDLVAKAVEGIDVIVDGHSHTALEEGRKVGNTLIVSTGSAFAHVGEVEVTIDEEGKVNSVASLLSYQDFADITPNAKVLEVIEKVNEGQKSILEKVVGNTAVTLVGERGVVRTGESNLAQLATDAMADLTKADVVITNGGGIRASIEKGDITMGQLATVFPFGNTIMVKEVKGSDIKAALEHGVSEYPNEKGAFPQTAGITFTLNAYEEVGNRIADLKVAGQAIDLNKTYSLATNDFMAAGGDGYSMFTSYPIKAEYNTLMDTLLDYISAQGSIKGEMVPRMQVVTEKTEVEVPVEGELSAGQVVGLRAYLAERGFEIKYDNSTKMISATKDKMEVNFTVGKVNYTTKKNEDSKEGKLIDAVKLHNSVSYINSSELDAILAELAA